MAALSQIVAVLSQVTLQVLSTQGLSASERDGSQGIPDREGKAIEGIPGV